MEKEKMPTRLEAVYMAGLFDGEGCVEYTQRFEKKRKNKPKGYLCRVICCEMAMTDEPVMRWFHKKLGFGQFRLLIKSKQAGGKPHHKDQWRWRCMHRNAYKFAKLIIPHSRVKREKLQKIIDHYDKLSLRHTHDRHVRVHHPVPRYGHHLLT